MQGELEAYLKNERSQIFNMILALYAGEDEGEVFEALNGMYARHPREVEFYIPQLCTYLFHFRGADDSSQSEAEANKNQKADEPGELEGAGHITLRDHLPEGENDRLKEFLIQKSSESLRFAHLMFWSILAAMDDTMSLQLSRH